MVAGAGSSTQTTDPYQIAPGGARGYTDNGDPGEQEWLTVDIVARWRGLVRSVQRIRRLQRIWGHLGQFLQTVCERRLRERVRQIL